DPDRRHSHARGHDPRGGGGRRRERRQASARTGRGRDGKRGDGASLDRQSRRTRARSRRATPFHHRWLEGSLQGDPGDLPTRRGHSALSDSQGAEHHGSFAEIDARASEARIAAGTYRYRWFSGAPLRDGKDALNVNWIGVTISDAKGKVTYDGAFVTSLKVSRENVAEIAACARARWKIENESFNILKNNG